MNRIQKALRAINHNVLKPLVGGGNVHKSVNLAQQLPSYIHNQPASKEWTAAEAISEGFNASHWVFRCVDILMKSAASANWYMETRKEGQEWVRWEDSPGEKLLNNPNPDQSGSDLMKRFIIHLFLAGNGLISKVRTGGRLSAIYTIEPDLIYPILDSKNYIVRYDLATAGSYIVNNYLGSMSRPSLYGGTPIQLNDIIHLMLPDPKKPWWGYSPLQASRKLISIDTNALDWQSQSFGNRCVPEGIYSVQHPQISDEQYLQIRADLAAKLPRESLILAGGTNWQQMSLSAVDVDYIETRKLTREEICAIFGVPALLVGILDKATYSNLEIARKVFWNDTMTPLLDDVQSTFNRTLAPEFREKDNVEVRFNYDLSHIDVLQSNLTELLDVAAKLFAIGYPVNAINQRLDLGMPELPEFGDVGFLQGGLIPATLLLASAVGEDDSDSSAVDRNDTDPDEAIDEADNDEDTIDADNEDDEADDATSDDEKAFNRLMRKGILANKSKYWKDYNRRRDSFQGSVAKKVNALTMKEFDAVIRAFEKADGKLQSSEIESIINASQREWERVFEGVWKELIEYFGTLTARDLGGNSKSYAAKRNMLHASVRKAVKADEEVFLFDSWSDAVRRYVKRTVGSRVAGIKATTRTVIQKLVGDVYDSTRTVGSMVNELRSSYSIFTKSRAMMIARTEIVGASNYGSRQAAKQSGLKPLKKWTDSGDPRVRDSHSSMAGETVELDETYSNGLMFPGDPSGSAEEVIGCRCVEQYELR